MRRFCFLVFSMLMFFAPALGEDVFTLDAASAVSAPEADLTTASSYLRVTCDLAAEAPVTLSIRHADGTLVYQRDHGLCSGSFRSEDVYLRLTGSKTSYFVTLQAGDQGYAFPVHLVMGRLRDNAACSVGYPLGSLTGTDTWKSVTLLDIAALEGRELTVPLHASGAYEIGSATFQVEKGQLTVTAQLYDSVQGSIDRASVQTAITALEAQTLGRKNFRGLTARLDEPIDLQGTPCAAVYLNLTVSFDPAGAGESPETELPGQEAVWQTMQTVTANEAVG